MLTFQRKLCSIVVKGIDLRVDFPSGWTVADAAAYFKAAPMGGIGNPESHEQEKQRYDQ